jgi:hypothetical protein
VESIRLHINIKREDGGVWWPDQYSEKELERFGLYFFRRDVFNAKEEAKAEEAAST